jgi:hypothetical protein
MAAAAEDTTTLYYLMNRRIKTLNKTAAAATSREFWLEQIAGRRDDVSRVFALLLENPDSDKVSPAVLRAFEEFAKAALEHTSAAPTAPVEPPSPPVEETKHIQDLSLLVSNPRRRWTSAVRPAGLNVET